MPTYEYLCRACGHEFELFQQMSEALKRKCPSCGRLKLQRLIGTGAGVIFKGGGFYETDYRSESYTKAAAAEKKAAEGTTTNGEKGTAEKEQKPASAADTPSKASTPSTTKGRKTTEPPSARSGKKV